MDPAIFDDLEKTVAAQGAEAALRRLCDSLRQQKDYGSLFYALLMQKRHQLGVSPIPTGPSHDLPESMHESYEDAIRQAGRLVGNLYLQEGNVPQAWAYFRMLGEPEPIRAALEKHQPAEGEDLQNLVQIAYYENVHPKKGFDWVIDHFGICSAITTLSSQGLPQEAAVKQHCLQALVRALYAELRERLTTAIEQHEGKPPSEASAPPGAPGIVRKLIEGRDWLFGEDAYHIDTSHLSSVVQMSINLTPSPEMDLTRELCAYGQRLSDRLKGMSDPPFEDQYRAFDHYLAILQGDDVEKSLDYFRAEAERADPETVGTYPAEVLVNLLLRLERPQEALAVARKYLSATEGRQLSCPGVKELCQQVKDYRTLAEVARASGDPVHFLAGLLAAAK
jgi:hypothetical protein